MPSVRVERLPVKAMGLGLLGFDHLQIVFRSDFGGSETAARQDDWFVIEGLREASGAGLRLAVEGWQGGTTLSEANGGLIGDGLVARIGAPDARGGQDIAFGGEAMTLWATLASYAADIEAQQFPYIAIALAGSPLPVLNSTSLVASLLHHAGLDVDLALPTGLRFSPGRATLLGTSRADDLRAGDGFTTLVGGDGADTLSGGDNPIEKFYGGRGNDTFRWSAGANVFHGGQPGLAYADDGHDTVDYTGAGAIRIEALPAGQAHVQPDFIVTHRLGQDRLLSIEEIVWDAERDSVTVGEGVGLSAVPPRPPSQDADGAERSGRRAELLHVLPDPSSGPLAFDIPDVDVLSFEGLDDGGFGLDGVGLFAVPDLYSPG